MKQFLTMIGLGYLLIVLNACSTAAHAAYPSVPDSLQDEEFIGAWMLLDQNTEPIQLWDGRILTGHDLAQFVDDHDILVRWGSEEICNGNSCSQLYCVNGVCTKFHEKLGSNPIYITPTLKGRKDKMNELVDAMAHEIFHYIQPFGLVDNTVFEEYWANYVGAAVAGKPMKEFDDYQPLNPACLGSWLNQHYILEGYKHLNVYPALVISQVEPSSSTTCPTVSGTLDQVTNQSLLTCGLDDLNKLYCQFPPAPTPTPEYTLVCTEYEGGLKGCAEVKTGSGK
jgi:hypothetical protein